MSCILRQGGSSVRGRVVYS